ncbi:MAG: molybdopterin cofactor-binding domain-containing protein [Chloroflexota bacterium]
MKKWRMTRRGFLIGLGATSGVVALGVTLGVPAGRLFIAQTIGSGAPRRGEDASPTAWFEINADNRLTLYIPKAEMGQGIHTALAQIAAEELEVDWQQLDVRQASTSRGVGNSLTGGSNSVSSLYHPLREAAATMREMLRAEAAAQLGVAAAGLVVDNGRFYPTNQPENSLTYGEIVQARTGEWDVPEEPPALKPSSEFRYIGQSLPRVDFLTKLTGQAIYGLDARLPNMLYGAVARPRTINGRLRTAKAGDALGKSGVVTVITEDGFAAVAAESRAESRAGVRAMALEWEEDDQLQQADLDAMVTVGEGKATVIQKEGDTQRAMENGRSIIAEYRTPFAAHAHLEPQAALVDVQPDKVRAWVSTQDASIERRSIAEALGRDEAEVEVQATYLGGGFGRKLNVQAAVEAARLSAAAGRPVHVGWTRTEEFRHGYLRPPTHSLLKATLDENGRLQAIEHQQASSDVAFAMLPRIAATIMGADFGAWRGSLIRYNIPNRRTVAWHISTPVPTGWWRSLGLLANTFAVESFMDEIAHAANVDPLALRLQNLPEGELGQRYRRVLEAVAERSGWETPAPPNRARGIACSVDVNTVVAQVAEVSVENGRIRVHKVTCAMDPGLVINPDGATAQAQGSIMMGLSSTFHEAIEVKNGMITAANFDKYPLLTMADAPEIDMILLESGDEPFGVGEPPLGPIAAAVANATFALTGQRLRSLPLNLT